MGKGGNHNEASWEALTAMHSNPITDEIRVKFIRLNCNSNLLKRSLEMGHVELGSGSAGL